MRSPGSFHSRRGRLGAVVAMAVAAMAIAAPTSIAGAAAASRTTVSSHHPSATKSPSEIQHVIVVMQSGHSFDNYFGTRVGVDGIPANVCQRVQINSKSCVKPYHLSSDQARAGLTDSLPRHRQGHRSSGRWTDSSVPSRTPRSAPWPWVISTGATCPTTGTWPTGSPCSTTSMRHPRPARLPNRLVAVAGQTAGVTSNTPPPSGISATTVFNQLDQAHLSWKYYVQGYPFQQVTAGDRSRVPLLAMPAVTGNPASASRIVSTNQYFTDLTAGHLPAVSYVTSTSGYSERSPQSPAQGEAFVETLVNALMQSSAWRHTALLLTYDDSGGWYDHAVPPTVGGVTWGLRVPAILVSPYARAGYVDTQQLDTASMPGLVDQVFHLPPLTPQVATSGSLLTGLDLHQQPISPTIPSHVVLVGARPAVPVIYLLYLGALLGSGLVIALAFRRARHDSESAPSAEVPPGAPA